MDIDRAAPLVARKEILIAAPVERVWEALTDIARWHEWQPDVSSARLEGDLAAGSSFRWKAKGIGITSILREVVACKRISWTGVSIGMRAVHIWTLEPVSTGTRVSTEESLSGWLARLMKLTDAAFLDKSLSASLQVLKRRVE